MAMICVGSLQTPSDLVTALRIEASHDAEMVAGFLDVFCKTSAGQCLTDNPERLTRDFLLALAAAMRLYRWEMSGVLTHLQTGLPSAHEALVDVWRSNIDAEAAARMAGLPRKVHSLFEGHFAWASGEELRADVAIGDVENEKLLEAIADFLWENRHNF